MKPIIEVQNLSKKYQINAQQQRYLSLRDSLSSVFSFNKNRGKEAFWALKDIDFKIEAGESVGIIGRNGAGKSTLLKILSRITPPTKGQIILRGRVASLLEVGTGFHPELSGRENVYFNGSILGLRKAEIDKKFDEIVNFSGVEQFIDTPLKQYSSGMQLRLAFAVAAHLEPEILVIDEVLAVGDAEFQKKCLGKMGEVSKSGRTVLFVSHNMGLIKALCNRGILLRGGFIQSIGDINSLINEYLLNNLDTSLASVDLIPVKQGASFTKISLLNAANSITSAYRFDEDIKLNIEFILYENIHGLELSVELFSIDGTMIFYDSNFFSKNETVRIYNKGYHIIEAKIPKNTFMPNTYSLSIALSIPNVFLYDYRKNVIDFSIEETGKRINSYKSGSDMGIINLELDWSIPL